MKKLKEKYWARHLNKRYMYMYDNYYLYWRISFQLETTTVHVHINHVGVSFLTRRVQCSTFQCTIVVH